ncbi:MAG: hypothetical protein CSA75_02095 [Sorangium cellulosum]|nr:MAG: hypothetical protein CSA75_02095 [Sorangium cellulosum]
MGSSLLLTHPASARVRHLREHELIDLHVPGSRLLGRRATVLTPTSCRANPLPVVVLLHGLGETGNERDGAYAWVERYGLATSYDRLLHPPVQRGIRRMRYLRTARAEQINRELKLRPFLGMILVCPYTPNVFEMNTAHALDEYAAWLVEVLLPEVRSRTPAKSGVRATGLDGCSLGGFISYQVFRRRPEAFFSCGGVQAAIGKESVGHYAGYFEQALKQHGERRLHFETSSLDPYHDANVALSKELLQRGVDNQLRVTPGPHNQLWLIESGTLEMLLWHDRALRE